MSVTETVNYLNELVSALAKDLSKVHRGNKSAAQRVRVRTIELEKVGKRFRKESVAAEKNGRLKKKKAKKKKR